MPNTVILAFSVEMALIALTSLMLIQPKFIFRQKTGKLKSFFKWGGLVFLCLTFCWSIVVGIVLSMNDLSLRI